MDKEVIDENEFVNFTGVNLKEKRKVYDNIHGFIEFSRRLWFFIDTPEFQRLKNIKQLGALHYVFPGATHTRFEHSLGTGYLAEKYVDIIMKTIQRQGRQEQQHLYLNKQAKPMSDQEKQEVKFTLALAGIMHDLGHGPFSHTFDNFVVQGVQILKKEDGDKLQDGQWKHEKASVILFRYIVKKYGFLHTENKQDRLISSDQVQRVVDLIKGEKKGKQRPWQFELISNHDTGIDVDKLDYFRRDAFYLGAKGVHINHQLLMSESRIIEDKICYPTKYMIEVNDIFYSRFKLYKTFYGNNRSIGIEFMIRDILFQVKEVFQLEQICQKIQENDQWKEKYVRLTDSILEKIQDIDLKDLKDIRPRYKQHYNQIKSAQDILKKIRKRDIYRFVREAQTFVCHQESTKQAKNQKNSKGSGQKQPKEIQNTNQKKDQDQKVQQKTQPQKIKEIFQASTIQKFILADCDLKKGEFCIATPAAGYGLKNENPLDKVPFFNKYDQQRKILKRSEFKAEQINLLYTKASSQQYAKVYVKDISNSLKADNAFKRYFEQQKELKVNCNWILGKTILSAPQQYENFKQVKKPKAPV